MSKAAENFGALNAYSPLSFVFVFTAESARLDGYSSTTMPSSGLPELSTTMPWVSWATAAGGASNTQDAKPRRTLVFIDSLRLLGRHADLPREVAGKVLG